MSFMDRFLKNHPQKDTQKSTGQQNQQRQSMPKGGGGGGGGAGAVAPERRGLKGENDEYGLAKRVCQAFDREPMLAEIETVTIEQNGTMVILSGTVPDQSILDRMERTARGVEGMTRVDVSKVRVGKR